MSFAVARRGGGSSSDYWDLATVLELACLGGDWATAGHALPRVIATAREAWMAATTRGNLVMLKDARARQGQVLPQLDEITAELDKREQELRGG